MMRHLIAAGMVAMLGVAPAGASAEQALQVSSDVLAVVRRIPIQHNGRVKPFDSFARETLKQITGAERFERNDSVSTVLQMMAEPEHWQAKPLIAIPFVPLRELLGMDRHTMHVSYSDLVASRKLMRMLPPIVAKQQRDEQLTMLEQETMDVFNRFVVASQVFEQMATLVPPTQVSDRVWRPILDTEWREAWASFITAIRAGPAASVQSRAHIVTQQLSSVNFSAYPARWRLELEVWYNRFAPFRTARVLYGMAALGLLAGVLVSHRWGITGGLVVLWMAFGLHAAGILIRVVLGGRPPVSNFFETMLWLPFVAVALALLFERIYRARYFAIAAALLAAVTLWLTDYVPLDSSIVPVVAVLRSNLWLTIHVLTIVASYGALALATMLAHFYGGLYLFRRARRRALDGLELFLYRTIQVGVVLLAGGIMLGAVWANASWGRYWGWDPKETWALITLLWFLAVLHGRFAGWIHGVGIALSTIGGFFLLLMTYYGVSFYLVGLHSYAGGHATPLPPLLIGYLLAELAFTVLVGFVALKRRCLA